jgi:hypothetical protein
MSVTLLNVLNTVAPLGADAFVDASGFLNLQGTPAFKTSSIDSVTITPYAAEQLQETTVTVSTVSNNAIYSLSFVYTDANSGMIESVPLTVTSDSTATDTEICNAFRALMTANTAINSIVAVSGTTTLIVTAKAGFPIFSLSTSDAKMTIVTGTLGRTSVGTGTSLIGTYPSTAGYFNAGGFTAASSIVATNNYTQVLVTSTTGSSAVILVNVGATAANVAALTGPVGTLTVLKAGYRAIWSAPATTTAAVTVTTGAIALSGGSTTFATLGARGGDAIVIGSEITAITGVTGLTAGFGTLTTAVSAATFNFVALRNLPL